MRDMYLTWIYQSKTAQVLAIRPAAAVPKAARRLNPTLTPMAELEAADPEAPVGCAVNVIYVRDFA